MEISKKLIYIVIVYTLAVITSIILMETSPNIFTLIDIIDNVMYFIYWTSPLVYTYIIAMCWLFEINREVELPRRENNKVFREDILKMHFTNMITNMTLRELDELEGNLLASLNDKLRHSFHWSHHPFYWNSELENMYDLFGIEIRIEQVLKEKERREDE